MSRIQQRGSAMLVTMVLIAALLFLEPISVRQWFGIGVLLIGLLLVVA